MEREHTPMVVRIPILFRIMMAIVAIVLILAFWMWGLWGLIPLLLGIGFTLIVSPPLTFLRVGVDEAYPEMKWTGEFERILHTGVHVIWYDRSVGPVIDTSLFGGSGLMVGVKSADGVQHTLSYTIAATFDITQADSDLMHKLIGIFTQPGAIENIAKAKIEEAIREVCGRHRALVLNNGKMLDHLNTQALWLAKEKLAFFGIEPFTTALSNIRPPAGMQDSLDRLCARLVKTEATAFEVRKLLETVQLIEDEADREFAKRVVENRIIEDNPNISTLRIDETLSRRRSASPIVITALPVSAATRRDDSSHTEERAPSLDDVARTIVFGSD